MTFDMVFPDAEYGFQSPADFFKANVVRKCCNCADPTAWFHLDALRFFCSESCHSQFFEQVSSTPLLSLPA